MEYLCMIFSYDQNSHNVSRNIKHKMISLLTVYIVVFLFLLARHIFYESKPEITRIMKFILI